ncbi:hypothetical protein GW796_09625 [archaeon]|nr:hypothetical protein [archaeon]
MYLNKTSSQYKNYQDFEKYARFIGGKFNINIQLESTRAETDGRTIFLPNVLTMTPKELEIMYAILLHEVGHIRYSTFSEYYFSSLKTKAHAFIANCIEDARIENLLMEDFGGASEIFTEFYCENTEDKELMKRVFKHDGSKPDIFRTLGFYIHNVLVNCKTSPLKKISGARTANRILKFWKENNIESLIQSSPLKNDVDVISLTNSVYDLFVKHFVTKDKSARLNFEKDMKEKTIIQNKMDTLLKEAVDVEEKVNEFAKEIDIILKKIKDFDRVNEPEIMIHSKKIEEINEKSFAIRERIQWKENFEKQKKAIDSLLIKENSLKNDLLKKQNEKTKLIEYEKGGVNSRGKELTVKQKENIKNKIDVKTRQEERITKRLEQVIDEKINVIKDIEIANLKSAENPKLFNQDIDVEQLTNDLSELNKKISEYQTKINEINEKKNVLVNDYTKTANDMNRIQSDFMEKVAKEMFEIDQNLRKSDFDVNILPELNYEDSWPEAAIAQEVFDKKATEQTKKIVRNGQKAAGMFGSNIRDIITFIDKKKEQVAIIDVTEIFKGKITISKFDDVNSDTKHTNFMEDKSVVGVFGTHREHIPLTTMFDSIKKENKGLKLSELRETLVENNVFYRDLKTVFARKFKFAKRDFWKGSQEEGSLDNRSLWKLPTNQGDDFYEVSNPKFINKVAATILVDISGSQNKEATEYGKKIRALVVGLSKALDEVHIKHEVVGFHAPISEEMRQMNSASIYTRRSNRLETIVYKDAAQKDQAGIMNMELQMTDNSDGESLRVAIKRLKSIRAKSHMVFIVSDGKPFLCDTDVSVLDEDFRSALRFAVREKVQVFGLGFFNQLQNFIGERFCNASDNTNVLKFFDKTSFK